MRRGHEEEEEEEEERREGKVRVFFGVARQTNCTEVENMEEGKRRDETGVRGEERKRKRRGRG